MQAPLQARFSDLPAVNMKEILHQRMFEDKSYEAHEDHKKLYDVLEKPLERDYSYQLLSDLKEARQKKRKRCDVPRTPSGSPPPQPLPPPPPAGAFGAPSTSGQQASKALSLSKSAASTLQSMAWTTSDTRYESAGLFGSQKLSSTDSRILDDSIPDEQVHLSNDEDCGNFHLPTADSRKGWWKPLPAEERPSTPELAWTIPSFTVSNVENNWATELVLAYETPAENSLLAKIGDMTNFLNYSRWRGITRCSQTKLNGRIQKEIKSESMLTDHCPSAALQVMMKAVSYPDFGLELLVPEQMWIDDVCTYDTSAKYGYEFKHDYTIIESPRAVVFPVSNNKRKIMRFNEIYKFSDGTLTRILEALAYRVKEFKIKRLNPGYEFKHDYTIIESPRAVVFPVSNNKRKIMRFNEIYKFSDGTLTRILEALAYRVKEFKIKRLNPGNFLSADNRPPMLEKDMYDSWKSRMELYMLNRQHGRMILESIENGPLLWPTVEEDGVTWLKKHSELSAAEAIQADCDVKATNIILQGLSPEVLCIGQHS
nr:hypothetical protein [Tanacetum cinerariifolium]